MCGGWQRLFYDQSRIAEFVGNVDAAANLRKLQSGPDQACRKVTFDVVADQWFGKFERLVLYVVLMPSAGVVEVSTVMTINTGP